MDLPIVFEPLKSSLFSASTLSFLFVLLSVSALFFLNRSKKINKHNRNILNLLSFFALLMSLGSTGFSWFLGERIGSVAIQEDRFETAYGDLNFDEIKDIIIKLEKAGSIMTPNVGAEHQKTLLIFTKTGERFTFSKNNYPVESMISPMRTAWEDATKKGSE